MRTLIALVLIAVGSLAATTPSVSTTINFADLPVGATDGSIDFSDASFASNTGRLYVGAAGGDHALCPLNGAHCVAALNVTFSSPVDNLTFLANGDNSASSSVFVSGVADQGAFSFIGSGFDGVVQTFTTFDLSAFHGITSISITNNDRAGLGYDVFSFDTLAQSGAGSTVPEPAAWALMLAGFGLVGSAMRRRNYAAALAS